MSTGQYTHSKSFAILKRVREQLGTNLTSGQYLQLLDTLLYRSLAPIVEHTNLFEAYLCSLIGWQEKHNKRKVSLVDKQAFSSIAVAWLLYPKWMKVQKLASLKLDRIAIYEFCRTFIRQHQPYVDACNCALKREGVTVSLTEMLVVKKRVEDAVNCSGSLIPVIQEVQYWLEEADNFKTAVLEKYVRMCLTHAQKDYVGHFKTAVPLDDIVQSYILIAARAIDKCDFRQGVITSHIQNWFLTARTHLAKNAKSEYVPETQEVVDDEAESIVDTMVRSEEVENVRIVARLLDPVGAGRAFLGILETRAVIEQHTFSEDLPDGLPGPTSRKDSQETD